MFVCVCVVSACVHSIASRCVSLHFIMQAVEFQEITELQATSASAAHTAREESLAAVMCLLGKLCL